LSDACTERAGGDSNPMATAGTGNEKATGVAKNRIPTFSTVEEEAEFWDTHDSAEFEDEFEDVEDVKFIGVRRDGTVILWLEPEAVEALTQRAKEQGTGPAALARAWILERLGSPAGEQ
jgi:hypothetical protein